MSYYLVANKIVTTSRALDKQARAMVAPLPLELLHLALSNRDVFSTVAAKVDGPAVVVLG